MTNEITNSQDVIDSRDMIERISELESELLNEDGVLDLETEDEDYRDKAAELGILQAVAEEGNGYAPDWVYGATLIRDSYFEDYARELADDIGAIDSHTAWPHTCIDWEEAASQLQQDYTEIDFDGVAYWIR